jgi:hypothetical protein
MTDVLRLSQRVIDLAGGDPTTFVSTVMFKNVTGIAVGLWCPTRQLWRRPERRSRRRFTAARTLHSALPRSLADRRTPLYLGSAATVLVTSLLERNGAGDPLIAHFSALVSQHRGDEAAYRDFADRYRTSSTALGFDAHIAIARAMR